ncbi:BspA family leucine-rich repeat surface protein [Lactococcus petauri]|uniref:BspA family leucine-rich repeat surface protein n=1 Tax=Lactococcus petauri TaxID=1940789 RepID=UPI003851CA73
MKKNKYKLKIIVLSTFVLGNILPGIASTIYAATKVISEVQEKNDFQSRNTNILESNSDAQEAKEQSDKSTDEKQEVLSKETPSEVGDDVGETSRVLDTDNLLESNIEEDLSKQDSQAEITNNKETEDVIDSGVCGTSPWWIDSERVLHIGEGELAEQGGDLSPWYSVQSKFNKIIIEGKVIAPSNSRYLFGWLINLQEIEGLSNLDTSHVTNMTGMFSKGMSLQKIDLSHFNTSNVEEMSHMFEDTYSLTSLDFSNFDTSKVTNMGGFFDGATKLSELTLGSKFNFVGENKSIKLHAIDTNTTFTGKWINIGKGTVNTPLGDKKWTSDELVANYKNTDADTFVWEKFGDFELSVETKPSDIPLGTNVSDIDPSDFIESVKLGDVELSKNDYTVKIKNTPKTTRIGSAQVSLEVTPKYDVSLAQNINVTSNIVWGSTIVVKNYQLATVDASVSLLHKEEKPYLNANEGSGFSSTSLSSRPRFKIYRNNMSNQIFTFSYGTVGKFPGTLASEWNTEFSKSNLQYGDVVVGAVTKHTGGANWKGENTFVSRNNTLITETVGYDEAYYELTPSGYRLLRLNQLEINNNQKVKLNTSKEEMNKNISNFISLPEHIENPSDFRMEFESVDTSSSGNKKSTINVYESLESGGEFKTTYEVSYTVNPEVTESYYDVNGKQIEQNQTTEFEYGKEFTPSPEKYIENKGELYIYRGWVDALPGTENIVPQEGVPEATKVEKNYYYIYDKADKFINVTLPTEMVFGTFENNKKISSKKYEIKNNSDELPIEVSLDQFDKVKSDIKLLSSNTPDPTQEEASAKLNLHIDNENIISGLTEATPTQVITKIDTNASRAISLEGTYFGNMNDKNILDYKMHLKFKAIQDNKN